MILSMMSINNELAFGNNNSIANYELTITGVDFSNIIINDYTRASFLQSILANNQCKFLCIKEIKSDEASVLAELLAASDDRPNAIKAIRMETQVWKEALSHIILDNLDSAALLALAKWHWMPYLQVITLRNLTEQAIETFFALLKQNNLHPQFELRLEHMPQESIIAIADELDEVVIQRFGFNQLDLYSMALLMQKLKAQRYLSHLSLTNLDEDALTLVMNSLPETTITSITLRSFTYQSCLRFLAAFPHQVTTLGIRLLEDTYLVEYLLNNLPSHLKVLEIAMQSDKTLHHIYQTLSVITPRFNVRYLPLRASDQWSASFDALNTLAQARVTYLYDIPIYHELMRNYQQLTYYCQYLEKQLQLQNNPWVQSTVDSRAESPILDNNKRMHLVEESATTMSSNKYIFHKCINFHENTASTNFKEDDRNIRNEAASNEDVQQHFPTVNLGLPHLS